MSDQHEQTVEHSKHREELAIPVFLVLMCFLPFVAGFFVICGSFSNTKVDSQTDILLSDSEILSSALIEDSGSMEVHVPLPDEVRGLYWTASTAGSSRGEELLEYMVQSSINAVIIDAKMDNGELAFVPNNESLSQYVMETPAISDLDDLLFRLKEQGIYRIARVAVMRDGVFARVHPEIALHSLSGLFWHDNIGSVWVDPASQEVVEYALALGEELYRRGFDEIQYDYVRFASDGSVNQIVYPVYSSAHTKIEVMQKFFAHVGGGLQKLQIPVSFDVFGMTFWSNEDYNIGQRLLDVLPYTNWVSPMVYPSHYSDGFEGYANPALYPYDIVKKSLDKGTENMLGVWSGDEQTLRKKWRPWLQDFDIGAVYTSDLIEAQIQATRDAGASGWILWNARNVYEPAQYENPPSL